MKNRLFILSFIFIIFVSISCTDEDEFDGLWEDNIKLSTKTVEFDANANSVVVTTEGKWWWVSCVTVDGKIYTIPANVHPNSCGYSIEQDCFVVERRDENTLFISVDKNCMNKKRVVCVGLEAGDYFDWVTVTQSGN